MKKSTEFGFSKSLDGEELQHLFIQVASQYCVMVLKKTEAQCNGCKNVTCPTILVTGGGTHNATCLPDIDNPNGYECQANITTTTTPTTIKGKYLFHGNINNLGLIFMHLQISRIGSLGLH